MSPPLFRIARILRGHPDGRKKRDCVTLNHLFQAAILNVKFKRIDAFNAGRRKNAVSYNKLLAVPGVQVPHEQVDGTHVYHQYTLRVRNRDDVKKRLDEAKVSSMIYYPVPLHLQAAYRDLNMKAGSLPQAEQAAREVLSLPMYPELTEAQVQAWLKRSRRLSKTSRRGIA